MLRRFLRPRPLSAQAGHARRRSRAQPAPHSPGGDLWPRSEAEPGQDVGNMGRDRGGAERQMIGDGPIREAHREEISHLVFTLTERLATSRAHRLGSKTENAQDSRCLLAATVFGLAVFS